MKFCPLCRNTYPDDYQTCPRDQATLTAASNEIVAGTVLRGKYEVLGQLGTGGMATVYKVRHKAFQELAAVKVVHQHFMHDPGFVKRFRNEAVVARQLKHPNAVRIDDFDYTEDGRPFIVMEYVEGRSLYDARKEFPGPWPAGHSIRIVAQAASALSAAHTLGIVHRDIKPSNLLLLRGQDGGVHIKVLDFGIAKVSENPFAGMTSVNTAQSLVIGTPEYMSPEQAGGRLETAIDGRSDLYSLGLVLYELLTGAHPFKADTPMGMLIQQLHTEPAPPESFEASVSPALSALVRKCLEKDPGKRFQNAEQLLAALADVDLWHRSQKHSQTRPKPVPTYAPFERPYAAATATPAPPEQTSSPHTNSAPGQPASQNGQSHSLGRRYSRSILICTGAVCLVLLILGVFFFMNQAHKPAATTAVATLPQIPTAQKTPIEAPQVNPPNADANTATIQSAPAVKAAPPKKVAISNAIMAHLQSDTQPAYPLMAKVFGVQGTVVLSATISRTGYVESLTVVSGPQMLRQAALDAVRTWHYRPYLLNGASVEVETKVNVNFTLAGSIPHSNAPSASPNQAISPTVQKEPGLTPDPNQQRQMAVGTWTDPATGLEWTKSDNGDDVTWDQANEYCQGLRLAGQSDWRLPTIGELQGIYDPGISSLGWHVKGNLRLSGVQWSSSSRGNASGGAWYFGFGGGKRNFSPLNDSTNSRALCVRRSGE